MALYCSSCNAPRETVRAFCHDCDEVTESYSFDACEGLGDGWAPNGGLERYWAYQDAQMATEPMPETAKAWRRLAA